MKSYIYPEEDASSSAWEGQVDPSLYSCSSIQNSFCSLQPPRNSPNRFVSTSSYPKPKKRFLSTFQPLTIQTGLFNSASSNPKLSKPVRFSCSLLLKTLQTGLFLLPPTLNLPNKFVFLPHPSNKIKLYHIFSFSY